MFSLWIKLSRQIFSINFDLFIYLFIHSFIYSERKKKQCWGICTVKHEMKILTKIVLFSKDESNWSKVQVNTCNMLQQQQQKLWLSFELFHSLKSSENCITFSTKILSSTAVNIDNVSWAPNHQHIRMKQYMMALKMWDVLHSCQIKWIECISSQLQFFFLRGWPQNICQLPEEGSR